MRRARHNRAVLAWLAALVLASSTALEQRLIVVSWDGAADWAVDRLLAEGHMPNLARWAASGTVAQHTVPVFPTKTPVCHASLWTGAWPSEHGIVGGANPVLPKSEHTILESRRAFDANLIRAEPFYISAAKVGKKVVVLSATHQYPPQRWMDELAGLGKKDRFVGFSGFESGIAPSRVVTEPGAFAFADARFRVEAFDDPADPTVGFDAVRLHVARPSRDKQLVVKPKAANGEAQGWAGPIRVASGDKQGDTHVRLFSLDPASGKMLLYVRAAADFGSTEQGAELEAYRKAARGFHDFPWGLYEGGSFGTTLMEDGPGTAEDRLLEILRFDLEHLRRTSRYAWHRWKPDVMMHYSYITDSAGVWVGMMDPKGPRYDAALAARAWSVYARVFAMHDLWVGDLLKLADAQTNLVLVSDHGMAPVHWNFRANHALEAAGLVARSADGSVYLARTRAMVPPWSGNMVVVNTTDRLGGIVAPEDKPFVVAEARRALLNAADPVRGIRVVERVWDPKVHTHLGLGGDGGDLYFDLADGYDALAGFGEGLVEPVLPRGSGANIYWGERRDTHAILYAHGPAFPKGASLGPMRFVDVMPTVCAALGFPPPRHATGHAVRLPGR